MGHVSHQLWEREKPEEPELPSPEAQSSQFNGTLGKEQAAPPTVSWRKRRERKERGEGGGEEGKGRGEPATEGKQGAGGRRSRGWKGQSRKRGRD